MLSFSTKLAAQEDGFIEPILEQLGLDQMMDNIRSTCRQQMADLLSLLLLNSLNSQISTSKQEVIKQLSLEADSFEELLACSELIQQVSSNDREFKPILDQPISFDTQQNCFYLARYWQMRQRLFNIVETQLNHEMHCNAGEPDWSINLQKAWHICQQKRWLIIYGVAGTGKSTLALQLLNQLFIQNPRVTHLVSQTGKAASRLSESISNAPYLQALKNPLVQCSTIHKLLEKRPGKPTRFNQRHCLPQEIILVDEASMVTWNLLDELLQAIQAQAMVIFLGDVNQLQSIGIGGFLNELIRYFPDNSLRLTKQHRFAEQSEIQSLAKLALAGTFFSAALPAPHCLNADREKQNKVLQDWCKKKWLEPIKQIVSLPEQERVNQGFMRNRAFDSLLQAIVLSPWRFSVQGVYTMNRAIQHFLYQRGALMRAQGLCVGMPVIVRKNLSNQQLFNGDRGVVVSDNGAILFDGHDSPLTVAAKDIDVAFVMTIHQAQGSEFDSVLLWLGEFDLPTRKWLGFNFLYTAITRAKKELVICGNIL